MSTRRVFIITGANSGLGFATTKAILNQDHQNVVVLACRDESASIEAMERIISEADSEDQELLPRMHHLTLNLASLASIRLFADQFRANFDRLDCLICNAGVMMPKGEEVQRTSDSFEIHVGVNHLGHFLLVNLLLDLITASDQPRIVIVSSMLLKEGQVNTQDLSYESGYRSTSSRTSVGYADSKLMNALFALELSERLSDCVRVFCVSPGFCKTRLHRNSSVAWYLYPILCCLSCVVLKSASKGCQTIVHCACGPSPSTGLFFRNKTHLPKMDAMLETKAEVAQELWTQSARLVGLPHFM